MRRSEMVKILALELKKVFDFRDYQYKLDEIASVLLEKVEEKGMEYIDNNWEHGWKEERKKKSRIKL